MLPHARLRVYVEIDTGAYKQLDVRRPTVSGTTSVSALVDTGAQVCVADIGVADKMGLNREELLSAALKISAANSAGLVVVGAGFVTISTVCGRTSRQMVY